MGRKHRLPWLLFFLWAAWLYALQGLAAEGTALGRWTPELGLCLLLSFDGRLTRPAARLAACLVAAARVSFSTDPPLAILAGLLAVVAVTGTLRSFFDLERPLLRGALAALFVLGLSFFWNLSWRTALASEGAWAPPADPAWRTALATGLTTVAAGALLVRLPGLRPLTRRRA